MARFKYGVSGPPRFVLDKLASCPAAGEGVNDWLFDTSKLLWPFMGADAIANELRTHSANCGRFVSDSEMDRQITRAKDKAWKPASDDHEITTRVRYRAKRWPDVDHETVNSIEPVSLRELAGQSPERIGDSEEAIDLLFPGKSLLCCGKSVKLFATRSRNKWRGRLAEMALIVPSPMIARVAKAEDGHMSEHTKEGTGDRRHLVIEFDRKGYSFDKQAGILLHLAILAPLVMVVHSGGKSLHGWFYCEGIPEDERTNDPLWKFMTYATSLGADPRLWLKSQFARMPGGTRSDGSPQPIYYMNSAHYLVK